MSTSDEETKIGGLYSNASFVLTVILAVAIFYLFSQGVKDDNTDDEIRDDEPQKENTDRQGEMAAASDNLFVLLLGVNETLFKTCFGNENEWKPYELRCLSEDCTASDVRAAINHPGLQSIVIQEHVEHPHWQLVKDYYSNKGGFVVFFGIDGVFDAPSQISQEIGVDWKFCAYTRHEYELTDIAKEILGGAITTQPYSKCNLWKVPESDRLMLPKTLSLEKFVQEWEGIAPDEVIESKSYERYFQDNASQCPLAMHKNPEGGRFAFLGFVNGDGNIPKIVRALLTNEKTKGV
jgi:hypothetical protein